MLLLIDGRFFQVLEGKKDDLEELYVKLNKDPRHNNVTIISQGPLKSRTFSDWSMRFTSISEEEFKKVSGFNKFLELFSLKPSIKNNPAYIFQIQ